MEIVKKYIELLKAAIWNQDVHVDVQPEEISQIVQLASFQGTGPLVFDQLLKLKDVEIPDALRMQMKQQCMMSMMLQQSMIPLLSQAWNALVKVDIHPVLLKGFGLAQYYPQPHLRQWGDVDLYVGQDCCHEACEVLRKEFPTAKYGEAEEEEDKHYNFNFSDTVIEVHRLSMECHHPCDRRYYEHLEKSYLTKDGPKIEVRDLIITQPEDTFNVFFVFFHTWHHFETTGMNMKQLCDVAVLLHVKRDVIDRKRMYEMLVKLHLKEVWQLIMYILVRHLGLPKDEAPFYTEICKDRAELLYNQVINEGSSRYQKEIGAEGKTYLKRKWMTLWSRIVDAKFLRPYAPRYARHKVIGDIIYGIERTILHK